MEKLEVIPGVFSTTDNSDVIARTEGEQTNREFTLTREQRCEVIRAMTLQTIGTPDLSDLHFPGVEHAIQCAKHFEDDVYSKASGIDQYVYPIANYANLRGAL
ncbi:hypothetical protein TcWFU_003970 [Taenia crassiceps]|uniref:Uncharacterized protein n=1 Tax=Taenia crassiceps TaxID=6207 RepID=A0ABR4QKT5_9CEST